jgi:hypothetical protein
MLGNGFRPQALPGHCELVRAVADNRGRLGYGSSGKPLNTCSGLDIRGRSSFRLFQPSVQDWCLQKAQLTSVYFAPSSFSASAAARFSQFECSPTNIPFAGRGEPYFRRR